MRICLVAVGQSVPGFNEILFDVIKKGSMKALRPETEVVMRPLKVGLADPKDFVNHYYSFLNSTSIVETIIKAERDGFDAAVLGCFGDTGVEQARAAVDIPVIGPAESTMMLACQMGRRFGIICANMPGLPADHWEQVRYHGLTERLIPDGIRPDIHNFADTWSKSFADPRFAADGVAERAREMVADGADVIVIGCCGIGPFCSLAGLHSIRVDDRNIPILDAQLIALKTAEMAADIRTSIGMPFNSLPRHSVEDFNRVRDRFGLPRYNKD